MVGEGPELARYQTIAKELGLKDHIEFKEAMPARKAFQLARSVIVPSRAEAFPYIVLEAIAAHKAVGATDVGGIPEIMPDADPALVPSGNVNALAEAMLQLAGNPNAPSELAKLADDLKQKFSIDVMVVAVEEAYRETLL